MTTADRMIVAGAILFLVGIGLVPVVRLERINRLYQQPPEYWLNVFAIGFAVSAGLVMLIRSIFYG